MHQVDALIYNSRNFVWYNTTLAKIEIMNELAK